MLIKKAIISYHFSWLLTLFSQHLFHQDELKQRLTTILFGRLQGAGRIASNLLTFPLLTLSLPRKVYTTLGI